jgi:cell wall-associated NlpC family hydrolase
MLKKHFLLFLVITNVLLIGCRSSKDLTGISLNKNIKSNIRIKKNVAVIKIETEKTKAEDCIKFAETLEGIKYTYGGSSIEKGFDCSGFVWYVFNHFNIKAPRTSERFTNAGKEVSIEDSKMGDIILFTGTDAKSATVGHMGFITSNEKGRITFIHASSGVGKRIMKSQMSAYFVLRFVKVIRVFY